MSPSYPSRFELRVAIALNNMGITMMERDCYEQAFETFKDAVIAVKIPVRLDSSGGAARAPANNTRAPVDLVKTLNDANQRLSMPQVSERAVPIRTVAQHDATSSLGSNAGRSLPTKAQQKPLSVIRLDLDDVDLLHRFREKDGDMKPDSQFPVTMILYNFGLAGLCLAAQNSSKKCLRYRQNRNAGIKLLRVCRSLLGQQLKKAETSVGAARQPAAAAANQNKRKNVLVDDPFQFAQLLFGATLVMEALVHGFTHLPSLEEAQQEQQEAKVCVSKLAHLRKAGQNLVRKDGSRWGAVADMCNTLPTSASAA